MGYASGAFENASSRRVVDDECSTRVVNCSCEERRKKLSCKQSVDDKNKRLPQEPVGNDVNMNDLKNKFVRSTKKVMKILEDLNIDERKYDVIATANEMCTMIKCQNTLPSLVGNGPPQTNGFNHFGSVESPCSNASHCANNLTAKIQGNSRSNSEHNLVVSTDNDTSVEEHCEDNSDSENTAVETHVKSMSKAEKRMSSIFFDNYSKDNVIKPDQVEVELQLNRSLQSCASKNKMGRISPPATYTPDSIISGSRPPSITSDFVMTLLSTPPSSTSENANNRSPPASFASKNKKNINSVKVNSNSVPNNLSNKITLTNNLRTNKVNLTTSDKKKKNSSNVKKISKVSNTKMVSKKVENKIRGKSKIRPINVKSNT